MIIINKPISLSRNTTQNGHFYDPLMVDVVVVETGMKEKVACTCIFKNHANVVAWKMKYFILCTFLDWITRFVVFVFIWFSVDLITIVLWVNWKNLFPTLNMWGAWSMYWDLNTHLKFTQIFGYARFTFPFSSNWPFVLTTHPLIEQNLLKPKFIDGTSFYAQRT